MRRAARIDENQPEIVKGLRRVGASVQSLAAVGNGCPDLLVAFEGETYLLEIKNPDVPRNDRELTPEQERWHSEWKGIINVVETLDQAIKVITQ